jgi:hypothetical protein
MTAAGIRPQARRMILRLSPTLEQHLSVGPDDKRRKGTMQNALNVSRHFFLCADLTILQINQYYAVRFHHCVLQINRIVGANQL